MSPRRVKRPSDKEDVFKELTDGDFKVFNTMKDLFVFAACVGHNDGIRLPFDKVAGEIPWSVFHGETDEPIIDSIALIETDDLAILLKEDDKFDQKLEIIEEYANQGLALIRQKLMEAPGDPLENLVAMIMENEDYEIPNGKISNFIDSLIDNI